MAVAPRAAWTAGRISIEESSGEQVLRLTGEVDQATVSTYEASSRGSASPPVGVIEASGVTFLAVAGAGFLLRCAYATWVAGTTPILRSPSQPVLRVLGRLGAMELFHVVP